MKYAIRREFQGENSFYAGESLSGCPKWTPDCAQAIHYDLNLREQVDNMLLSALRRTEGGLYSLVYYTGEKP